MNILFIILKKSLEKTFFVMLGIRINFAGHLWELMLKHRMI